MIKIYINLIIVHIEFLATAIPLVISRKYGWLKKIINIEQTWPLTFRLFSERDLNQKSVYDIFSIIKFIYFDNSHYI